MPRFGGTGFEAYGDPIGAGGAMHVMRARAVEGQTVRVVFNEEPQHLSAAAPHDALTPWNYEIVVTSGAATAPLPVGVKPVLASYPSVAVLNEGEFGVDVLVDRPFVAGLSFSVTVQNVWSKSLDTLGAPYSANFVGLVPLRKAHPRKSGIGYMDIASDPLGGGYKVDNSGDLANHTGLDSLKKRILRRVSTPKGSFSWMDKYGVGFDVKKPMTVNRMMLLKVDLADQIRQEPEVASVESTLTKSPLSFVIVSLKVKTKTGTILPMTMSVSNGGEISLR